MRLLAGGVGLALALVLGEVVVRFLDLGNASMERGTFHVFDEQAGWKARPNCDARYVQPGSFDVRVRCNSRGLRDRELDAEKPPGIRRVVCLGDSFMWGYGVEEEQMFSRVLERELERTETINLGANGYSTVQELIRFEVEGIRYAPDWTVLFFCWNDLEDNFDDKKRGRPKVELLASGEVRIVNRPVGRQWKSPLQQWLRHNSRLFVSVEHAIKLRRNRAELREDAKEFAALELDPKPPSGAEDASGKLEARMKLSLLDLYAPSTPDIELAWDALGRVVEGIRELATQAGSKLLLVYVADRSGVIRASFEELRAACVSDDRFDELDWDRPGRRLAGIASALGVPCVDVTLAFRQDQDPGRLFLRNNPHWSAAGHELAASRVAAKISESGGD